VHFVKPIFQIDKDSGQDLIHIDVKSEIQAPMIALRTPK
jgi:hypothetical protein